MKKAVVIVVVVAAVAVGAWYFLGYRDQQAQKQTVADVRNTGTAMFSWLTDQVGMVPEGPEPNPNLEGLAHQKNQAIPVRAEQTTLVTRATLALAAPTLMLQNTGSIDVASYKKRTAEEVEKILMPQYLQKLPKTDGWGHPYEYYLETENVLASTIMLIRSPGRDGKFSGSVYQINNFEPGSFDEDIVWADGFFVRWPQAQPAVP